MLWALHLFALASGSAGASTPPIAGPELPPIRVSLRATYAETQDFWNTVSEVQNFAGNLDAVNSLLERKYGTYEEAFASVAVGVHGLPPLGRSLFVETIAEGIGTGLISNPVVPELHACTLLGGILKAGLEVEALHARAALYFGLGSEQRIDAFSSDLIDALPVRRGSFRLYGAELEIHDRFSLGDEIALSASLYQRITGFETSVGIQDFSGDLLYSVLAYRWRAGFELRRDHFPIGVDFVAGPQPLPTDVLPLIWDYAHEITSFPELGAMIGGGLSAEIPIGPKNPITAKFGFFGGYWGGQLDARYRTVKLSLMSWGLESSSVYRGLGQRIWLASLGTDF